MSSLLFSSVGTPTPVVVQKRRQRIIRAHSSFRSFPSFSVLDESSSFSTQNKSNTENHTCVAGGERTETKMFRKRNNSNSNNDNKILKSVLLVQTVLVLLSTSSINAHALEANEQTESNAFVQTLLQKTEEKREERQKERVLEYSKKNFKDYLTFVDNGRTAKTENDVKIKEWLEKNK
ncbi:unnamed protein product [Bathycoccus prasinos]